MPVFETIDFLEQYVQNVTIPQIADVIEPEVKDGLNQVVEEELYRDIYKNVDDDSFYEHTFGLRDSAMMDKMGAENSRVGGELLLDFYLDPNSKYYSYYPLDKNQDVTDMIVEWLSEGHKGYFRGMPINYKGKDFFGKAMGKMSKGNKLKSTITNNLKRLGYVIGRLSSDSD